MRKDIEDEEFLKDLHCTPKIGQIRIYFRFGFTAFQKCCNKKKIDTQKVGVQFFFELLQGMSGS